MQLSNKGPVRLLEYKKKYKKKKWIVKFIHDNHGFLLLP